MKLYKHQEEILELLESNNQFAIFAEQGCGKTLPMLVHISNLLISGEISNALIIAPLSALGSWTRDMDKFSTYRKSSLIASTTLINYEKISKLNNVYINKEYDLIVLDESHCIANINSNRTKTAIGYGRGKSKIKGMNSKSKYRYIMTGTPISNGKLEQYYTQMEFLKPGIFGRYNEFKARYVIERPIPGTFQNFIVGYRNKEELLEIISRYSYRITKKECLDLPEKLEDIVINCKLVEKTKYKQACKNFIEEFNMDIANPLAQTSKLRQLASGHVKDDFGEVHYLKNEKIKMLDEIVDSIGDKKIVIFAEFEASINIIESYLKDNKKSYVILNGAQHNKEIWKDFQNNDSIQFIICQYKSANSGIDLYSSSYIIFYEPNLSTTITEQAKDRIHRIGQKDKCSYYWLLTEDTIDYDIYDRLYKKTDFNNQCLIKLAEKINLRRTYGVGR